MYEEVGHIAIQSTRPQTLAAGLVDSPVAQLAWIIDKCRGLTIPGTPRQTRYRIDSLPTWLTGTAGPGV